MTEEGLETEEPVYCIDSSSLIAMWKERYPKEVFPSLWENKLRGLVKCRLGVCKQVWQEIDHPDLKESLSKMGLDEGHLLPECQDLKNRVAEIINKHPAWAKGDGGREVADPYIIAFAKEQGMVVVTEELPFDKTKPGAERKRRSSGPKIPDVCKEMGVEYMTLLSLFRNERWKF